MSGTLNIRNEDLELLNVLSDASFDMEYSIEQAKEILMEIELSHPKNVCKFTFDKWGILGETRGNFTYFDFNETRKIAAFQKELDSEMFTDLVKAWIAHHLSLYSTHRAGVFLKNLNSMLKSSNCFHSNKESIESLKNELYGKSERTRLCMCAVALNFLDYSEGMDDQLLYTKMLVEINREIDAVKLANSVRELPSPRDIMIFENVMEDFFSNIPIPSNEYFRFFSVYLWWNLTNVIPIRPSEFCNIDKNGLIKKNGEFYLKLPRSSKGKRLKKTINRNRIQIVDTIKISYELGWKIEEYQNLTESFRNSKTLISYNAWEQMGAKYIGTRKRFKERYSLSVFYNNLNRFHEEIIKQRYGITIRSSSLNEGDLKLLPNDAFDMSRALRPGDTRHFAFINLMRQGYHPIEIARLGGHVDLRSQYHYHQHVDYFMDTEILKLMSRFKFQHQHSLNKNTVIGPNITGRSSFTDTEFKKKFVFRPSRDLTTKFKLEDGYCIQPSQNCPVDECLVCDYWRIDIHEYNEKREQIKKRAGEIYDNTKELMEMLRNLHQYIIENYDTDPDSAENSLSSNKDLVTLSKQLDDALIRVSQLNMIEERKVIGCGNEQEE
ncbi:hypothetical protein ORM67_26055 [Bacillus cereus]|uniref:hypothetical protein n=1 Tax=Bacillus cereus TaxID=1396 RepID=UPI002AC032A0|nr:hypothetical protein [Bacillus cereus]MDZ4654043.1 hypothetical protein [Bacillus cereus]